MYFPALDNVVHLLSTLPGIGPRSALRIAFHLLERDPVETSQLASALMKLREEVLFCKKCGGLSDEEICHICRNDKRRSDLICIVEDPADVFAIEKTNEFSGLYHVLMGALSPLDGIGPEDLRLKELAARLEVDSPAELFIATNPTLEGDATASFIMENFRRDNIRITRISHGIPTGAAIEYADRNTLAQSIRNRLEIK